MNGNERYSQRHFRPFSCRHFALRRHCILQCRPNSPTMHSAFLGYPAKSLSAFVTVDGVLPNRVGAYMKIIQVSRVNNGRAVLAASSGRSLETEKESMSNERPKQAPASSGVYGGKVPLPGYGSRAKSPMGGHRAKSSHSERPSSRKGHLKRVTLGRTCP
jgi:hypothetical protein